MRLVSLNAWGGREWDALRTWVPRVRADILCLQEVTRAPADCPDWLIYRDPFRELSQRSDLFGDICDLLPGHRGFFAPAARGELQDTAGTTHLSEHGLAFWVRRDLALSGLRQDFVWGDFRGDGWGEEPVPRAIQIGRIGGLPGAGTLTFAHFHGLRDAAGKGDTPARAQQAQRLVASLGAFAAPGEPMILAGDFNFLPDSATFAALATLGLRDLNSMYGITDTRTSLYPKPQRHADYLMVNSDVAVRAFDAPAEPEVSDHRPLILEFDKA